MKKYTENEVADVIVETIKSKIPSLNLSDESYRDKHFFGSAIAFHARELAWLIFFLQQKFSVQLTEDDIINGYCYTISSLSKVVANKISNTKN